MNLLPMCSYDTADAVGFSPEGLQVEIRREVSDPDWDAFLARCPYGHHEQTSLWAELKRCYGWESLRIVVTVKGRILGGVQVLTKRLSRWGRIGYILQGPVAASHDPGLIDFVLAQLHQVAVTEKLAYVAVTPPYSGHAFGPGLQRLGFRPKPNILPPVGVMTASMVLDLSPDVDSLMAGIRATTRRDIRRANRAGVIVREGLRPDVETFRNLMWALSERLGSSPVPPQKDFFENLWRIFHPSRLVRIFVAEFESHPIAALLTFPFGDTVREWKVGWAGDNPELSPRKILEWEAICWSKRNGYRFYDFVGIDRTLALALKRGESIGRAPMKGSDDFKIGFGGYPVLLPEPLYCIYHPLLRLAAEAGGNKLLESPTFASFLARLWDKQSSPSE